jgi:biopolymer transport protein ExbD
MDDRKMRIPFRHRDSGSFDATMTPMIDVVFQLMIFFVCTASFNLTELVLPSRITAEETAGGGASLDPQEADLEQIVLMAARRDGQIQWRMNDRVCRDVAELRKLLAQLQARMAQLGTDLTELPVIFDIERTVPLGDVIEVYDACRLEGYRKLQFAARAQ